MILMNLIILKANSNYININFKFMIKYYSKKKRKILIILYLLILYIVLLSHIISKLYVCPFLKFVFKGLSNLFLKGVI